MKSLILSLLSALVVLPASASVTYQWHNLTPFESVWEPSLPVEFSGAMTFDDATVASGHVSNLNSPNDYTLGTFYPYFGLELAYLNGTAWNGRIESCSQFNAENGEYGGLLNCDVFGEKVYGGSMGHIDVALNFVGPYLRGSLDACGWEGCIDMASFGNLWRINDWSSDAPGTWCEPFGCAGMVGYWQRTVPEPTTLSLLFPLVAGVWRLRRDRQSA